MSSQLLIFYVAAALALLGALLALTSARPLIALRWFGLTLAALLVIEHQLVAPLIGLLSLLFFAAAAAYLGVVAGHTPPPTTEPLASASAPSPPLTSAAPSPLRANPSASAPSPPLTSAAPSPLRANPSASTTAATSAPLTSAAPSPSPLQARLTDAPRSARSARITRIALPLVAVLALAWVLTGTWARQHAWPGQELAPDAGFGGLGALTSALSGQHLGVLIALVLLLLVVAVGGLASLDLDRRDDPPPR